LKIQIVNGNGLDVLVQDISKDNIPKFLGGNSECPFLETAGGVYGKAAPGEGEQWEEVQISAKDKFELKFQLKKDDLIAYRFRCDNKDIGFAIIESLTVTISSSIFNLNQRFQKTEVVPNARHLQGQTSEGQIAAPIDGEYIVQWDNSFSKLRKKKIQYSIHIEPQTSETPIENSVE